MRDLQFHSTVRFDSDLSSTLNLSVKFIFILMWPAAVVVAHDATQCGRKEWAIPYRTRPQNIFLVKRMQHRCCSNIADNQFLKVRNSWQQCWNYVTLMMDCSLFYTVTSMHLAQRYLQTNTISSELHIQIFISSFEGQTVYSHASCSARLIWAKRCFEVTC